MSENITLTDGQNVTAAQWDAAFTALYPPMVQELQLWWDLDSVPNVRFSIFFAVAFAICFFLQLNFLRLWRTWSYSFSMLAGLALEIGGYIARAELHYHPFSVNWFLVNVLCLSIAPFFFTSAIYLVLTRIIVRYGIHDSRLSPRAFLITFMSFDLIFVILQAVDGGVGILASTWSAQNLGMDILLAGVVLQVFSLLIFIYFAAEIFGKMGKVDKSTMAAPAWTADQGVSSYAKQSYGVCCSLYGTATILILIRSVYRIALFAHGFNDDIASDQRLFATLESWTMFVALLKMTLTPPGWFMGRDGWKLSGWDEKKWQILETKDPSSTVDNVDSSDPPVYGQQPYMAYDGGAYTHEFQSSTVGDGDLRDPQSAAGLLALQALWV